jgi:hypothetical protein
MAQASAGARSPKPPSGPPRPSPGTAPCFSASAAGRRPELAGGQRCDTGRGSDNDGGEFAGGLVPVRKQVGPPSRSRPPPPPPWHETASAGIDPSAERCPGPSSAWWFPTPGAYRGEEVGKNPLRGDPIGDEERVPRRCGPRATARPCLRTIPTPDLLAPACRVGPGMPQTVAPPRRRSTASGTDTLEGGTLPRGEVHSGLAPCQIRQRGRRRGTRSPEGGSRSYSSDRAGVARAVEQRSGREGRLVAAGRGRDRRAPTRARRNAPGFRRARN